MWETIILGLVQGLTEFLPVSSSGHLVAARALLGISDAAGTAVDAFLHLGTLLAVLVYFWKTWRDIVWALFNEGAEAEAKRQLLAKLAAATVPGAIAGYALQNSADDLLRDADVVASGLLITAIALFFMDILARRATSIARASWRDVLMIGLAQAAALIPGISRSGVTIAAARWRGLSREQAAKFSFLLSAPIIAGAGLAALPALAGQDSLSYLEMLTGFLVAFVSGLAAIGFLLKLVTKISFWPFAVYLVALAGVLFYVG